MSARTIHGFKVEILELYRTGKSQYEGAFTYQLIALVDGKREVFYEHASNTVREVKQKFEWSLQLRRDRLIREGATATPRTATADGANPQRYERDARGCIRKIKP